MGQVIEPYAFARLRFVAELGADVVARIEAFDPWPGARVRVGNTPYEAVHGHGWDGYLVAGLDGGESWFFLNDAPGGCVVVEGVAVPDWGIDQGAPIGPPRPRVLDVTHDETREYVLGQLGLFGGAA